MSKKFDLINSAIIRQNNFLNGLIPEEEVEITFYKDLFTYEFTMTGVIKPFDKIQSPDYEFIGLNGYAYAHTKRLVSNLIYKFENANYNCKIVFRKTNLDTRDEMKVIFKINGQQWEDHYYYFKPTSEVLIPSPSTSTFNYPE